MKLSIVLLIWNSAAFIKKCLDSLYKSSENLNFEIIIVDNGSKDNTCEIISNQYPSVKLIRNAINRGIAPARNQGIREAKGKYILILDIDTQVLEGAIPKMLAYMEEHPEIGLCGPKLMYDDGTMQQSFRRFPLVQTKFLRRVNVSWAKRLLKNEYYEEALEARNVDYVIGACQLIRRSALEMTGLLDDKIFYGPEDVDLCLRMWLKGWKVAYLPFAQVTHYEQRITQKKLFSYLTLMHLQGLIHYFFKHKYFFSRKKLYQKINTTQDREQEMQ